MKETVFGTNGGTMLLIDALQQAFDRSTSGKWYQSSEFSVRSQSEHELLMSCAYLNHNNDARFATVSKNYFHSMLWLVKKVHEYIEAKNDADEAWYQYSLRHSKPELNWVFLLDDANEKSRKARSLKEEVDRLQKTFYTEVGKEWEDGVPDLQAT